MQTRTKYWITWMSNAAHVSANTAKARMASRSSIGVTSLLSLLLLPSSVGLGQMGTRNISGTVTDRHHEPLRGAVIEVENDVTEGVISYITSRDGKYSFKRLDGDTDYRLWVSFKGQRSKARNLSQFDRNCPKVIDFVIKLN